MAYILGNVNVLTRDKNSAQALRRTSHLGELLGTQPNVE